MKLIIIIVLLNVTNVSCKKKSNKQRYFNTLEYLPYLLQCECGIANVNNKLYQNRIIGGVSIRPHQFPWLVFLQYQNELICGGSIISDLYVLSAAHCFPNGFQKDNLKAVVGQHNWCQPNSDSIIISINKIIIHPNFDQTNFFADIMLLRLSMRLSYNEVIRPICLPRYVNKYGTVSTYAGQNALVIGWGYTETLSVNLSCVPMKLYVPVLEQDECDTKIKTLFCAGFPEGGRDTCQGDSGGPLQYKSSEKRYEIIGVVSSAVGCALPRHPNHYTDVNQFVPWILKNTVDSNICW